MPAAAVAAAGLTAPAVVAPDSPVAAMAVSSSPTAVAASSSPAASPVDIVAASSSPAAAVAAFGSPAVVVASNSPAVGSLAAVVSPVCATSPVAACHPPTASSLLSGPSGGGPAFPASPLCSRRSPLLADGIAASYAEPTGLFFDELDALAMEFGPAVPSPPRVSPVPPSASGAGTSLLRTACTPPTGGEWLRPESPLPQQAPTLVVDVPDGVLYDVPMVVLDLDGRPLAHSLPSSVADNAALHAFLTSCSRPLPPALLPPPLPLPPLTAKAVEVVPKHSERIAAKMALEALEGPIHAVSRAPAQPDVEARPSSGEGPSHGRGGRGLQRPLLQATFPGAHHRALLALLQLLAPGQGCGGVGRVWLIGFFSSALGVVPLNGIVQRERFGVERARSELARPPGCCA
ncbi:hypothetical protein OsJ_13572 [Oryza sativa Japonica Group]|uniref:Uncharacterized protein n=1 Tax=Oryza sativa subsp. japonica TaxID=39947 RepID=A3AQA7_ORYSJ|nr:hypothetical protein OsJ_13572 [Oryza sativa Japonica Group]